jgi:hypothetical protein
MSLGLNFRSRLASEASQIFSAVEAVTALG